MQKQGCTLVLRDVTGKARVYLDERLAAEKADPSKDTVKVSIPAGSGEHVVSVVVEASSTGARAGLGGTITVE
jgi:beta-galactosidase